MNVLMLALLVTGGCVLAIVVSNLAGPAFDALAARLDQTGADRC